MPGIIQGLSGWEIIMRIGLSLIAAVALYRGWDDFVDAKMIMETAQANLEGENHDISVYNKVYRNELVMSCATMISAFGFLILLWIKQ